MDASEVLKEVLSTTAIVAVLGVVGRELVKSLFKGMLDTHKANLEDEHKLALARIDHDYRLTRLAPCRDRRRDS